MPNIVIKDAKGQDEVWPNVNSVSFLDEQGQLVNYDYNGGDPTWSPPYRVAEGKNPVWFLDFWGNICHYVEVENGGCAIPPKMPKLSEDGVYEFIGWNYSEGELNSVTRPTVVASLWKFANLDARYTAIKYSNYWNSSFYVYVSFKYKGTGSIEVQWSGSLKPETFELSNETEEYKEYHKSHYFNPHPFKSELNQIYDIVYFKKLSGNLQIINNNYYPFLSIGSSSSFSEYCSVESMQIGTDVDAVNVNNNSSSSGFKSNGPRVVMFQKCYPTYKLDSMITNSGYINIMFPAGTTESILEVTQYLQSGAMSSCGILSLPSNYIMQVSSIENELWLAFTSTIVVIPKYRIASTINKTIETKLVACHDLHIPESLYQFVYINFLDTTLEYTVYVKLSLYKDNPHSYTYYTPVSYLQHLIIESSKIPIIINNDFLGSNVTMDSSDPSQQQIYKCEFNAPVILADNWSFQRSSIRVLKFNSTVQLGIVKDTNQTVKQYSLCKCNNLQKLPFSNELLAEMAVVYYKKYLNSLSDRTGTFICGTPTSPEQFNCILKKLADTKALVKSYMFNGTLINPSDSKYIRIPDNLNVCTYMFYYIGTINRAPLHIVINNYSILKTSNLFKFGVNAHETLYRPSVIEFYLINKTPPDKVSGWLYYYEAPTYRIHVPKGMYQQFVSVLHNGYSYMDGKIVDDLTDDDIARLKGEAT